MKRVKSLVSIIMITLLVFSAVACSTTPQGTQEIGNSLSNENNEKEKLRVLLNITKNYRLNICSSTSGGLFMLGRSQLHNYGVIQ